MNYPFHLIIKHNLLFHIYILQNNKKDHQFDYDSKYLNQNNIFQNLFIMDEDIRNIHWQTIKYL